MRLIVLFLCVRVRAVSVSCVVVVFVVVVIVVVHNHFGFIAKVNKSLHFYLNQYTFSHERMQPFLRPKEFLLTKPYDFIFGGWCVVPSFWCVVFSVVVIVVVVVDVLLLLCIYFFFLVLRLECVTVSCLGNFSVANKKKTKPSLEKLVFLLILFSQVLSHVNLNIHRTKTTAITPALPPSPTTATNYFSIDRNSSWNIYNQLCCKVLASPLDEKCFGKPFIFFFFCLSRSFWVWECFCQPNQWIFNQPESVGVFETFFRREKHESNQTKKKIDAGISIRHFNENMWCLFIGRMRERGREKRT